MAKNYEMIRYIREQLKAYNSEVIELFTRMFNRLDNDKKYAAALSSSVSLCVALRAIGYEPELILGTVGIDTYTFFHVWIEMDEKIFDLDIYFDSSTHPVLKDKITTFNPQLGKTYNDAEIDYYAFQFGDLWEMADLKRVVGKTFYDYCEEAGRRYEIWSDILYILDWSQTNETLNKLYEIAKKLTIRETDEEPKNIFENLTEDVKVGNMV